jgi:hypothetical protein
MGRQTDRQTAVKAIPDEFVRPNGKVYRPRRARLTAQPWGDVGNLDGHGVIVFGTLDPDAAREFAETAMAHYSGENVKAVDPIPGWWRSGYTSFGPTWVTDDVRGRPGVYFTAEGSDE